MRPILKALPGALPAKHTTEWGPVGKDAEDRGYVLMDHEEARPLVSNEQLEDYRNSIGTLGNDGTSAPSYFHQPVEVDALVGVTAKLVEVTESEQHEHIGEGDEASKVSMRGRETQKTEEHEED